MQKWKFWGFTKTRRKNRKEEYSKEESSRVETTIKWTLIRGYGAAGGVLPQETPEEAEESRAGPVRRGTMSVTFRGQCQQLGNRPHLQSPEVHLQVKQVNVLSALSQRQEAFRKRGLVYVCLGQEIRV